MRIDKDLIELVQNGKMKSGNNYGTGMIVVDPNTGKILIGKRTDTHDYCSPGGKVEIGETPLQGVIRETKEEANIDVNTCMFYGYEMHTAPNGKNWVSFMFITWDWSGDIKNQESEVEPWEWVEPDIAMMMDLFPPSRKSLDIANEAGLLSHRNLKSVLELPVFDENFIPFIEVPTSPFHSMCNCAYSVNQTTEQAFMGL